MRYESQVSARVCRVFFPFLLFQTRHIMIFNCIDSRQYNKTKIGVWGLCLRAHWTKLRKDGFDSEPIFVYGFAMPKLPMMCERCNKTPRVSASPYCQECRKIVRRESRRRSKKCGGGAGTDKAVVLFSNYAEFCEFITPYLEYMEHPPGNISWSTADWRGFQFGKACSTDVDINRLKVCDICSRSTGVFPTLDFDDDSGTHVGVLCCSCHRTLNGWVRKAIQKFGGSFDAMFKHYADEFAKKSRKTL